MNTTTHIGAIEPGIAMQWYQGWLDAWNSHDPEQIRPLITDDFELTTPTSTSMSWDVRGDEDTVKYARFVVRAYPDLIWEQTGPPLFAHEAPRVAFCWRGTGTFSGRLDPPGIDGSGRPFAFTGVEVFDFRGQHACAVDVAYDLQGLMRQILPRR